MKNLLLTIILSVFFAGISQAQITKCRASTLSYREKTQNTGQWSRWSAPTTVDILITIDDANNRIKIFSDQEQVYDIIKAHGKTANRKGEDVHKWECINDKGIRCYVYITNAQTGNELSVEFSDLNWKYTIRVI